MPPDANGNATLRRPTRGTSHEVACGSGYSAIGTSERGPQ